MRTNGRLHELANASAMAGRNEVQRRKRHEVQLQCELTVDLIALFLRDTVPLIYSDQQRAPALERQA
jgi:hypothetical protein